MEIFDWILFGVSLIIFCFSGLTVLYQVFFGLNKTGLNDKYIWGLNIQGFFALSSFGTGILILLSAMILFLGEDYPKTLFQFASSIAFACLISSQLLMGADLGKPLRALRILIGKNFTSPLTLDFLTLGALTILSFLFTFGLWMNIPLILRIWAYAVLLTGLLCTVSHSLLFISRVSAGYHSQPFLSTVIIGCALWSGTAILLLCSIGNPYYSRILNLLILATAFIFILSLGGLLSAMLGGKKPHNLISVMLSGAILFVLLCRGIVLKELIVVDAAVAILVLVSVFVEKYESVIHFQKDPVLPAPYCRFEKQPPYHPSILEIGNFICGLSFIIVITYGIVILKNIKEVLF